MSDRSSSRPQDVSSSPDSSVSGLQQFIEANTLPKASNKSEDTHHLALRIAHNLRFQHNWTDVRIHYQTRREKGTASLPRPVISGLPPQRLYVHADEQIDLLQRQRREGKAGWPELASEREWVLPTQLGESWSLRRFAEVFNALSCIPPDKQGGPLFFEAESWSRSGITAQSQENSEVRSSTPNGVIGPSQGTSERTRTPPALSKDTSSTESGTGTPPTAAAPANPWRTSQPKRMLLASLDDDSTAVYYIIHDGLVKPRQN
ncbi:hypothetical protein LTR86_010346 [Recurvomyces mirabilis]|nr:hypothetical protein LTR86_010346 [Recurvomyces mirabilis]